MAPALENVNFAAVNDSEKMEKLLGAVKPVRFLNYPKNALVVGANVLLGNTISYFSSLQFPAVMAYITLSCALVSKILESSDMATHAQTFRIGTLFTGAIGILPYLHFLLDTLINCLIDTCTINMHQLPMEHAEIGGLILTIGAILYAFGTENPQEKKNIQPPVMSKTSLQF